MILHFVNIVYSPFNASKFCWIQSGATDNSEVNKKTEGLLGIRSRVWLMTLGPVALCIVFMLLRGHHDRRVGRDDASARTIAAELTVYSNVGVHPRGIRFIPAIHGRSQANEESVLSMAEQMAEDRRTWVDNPDGAIR